jgi:hypothetical protein
LAPKFPEGSRHTFFDKKTGFNRIPDAQFEIHFGDGSYAKGREGSVGTADLIVGGLTVESQAVEVADHVHKSFFTSEGDGLLGLAWGSINSVFPRPVHTPVENMISQGDISEDQELFTCKLGSVHDKDEPDHGESFYTFGFIDQPTIDASEGPIWYTPLVHDDLDPNNGFWRFASTSIVVNGKSFARAGNTAIADTGTTLALIDDQALKHIYKQIPGAKLDRKQGWIYPANTTLKQLPVITIDVGGKQFVIQKEDIGFAKVDADWVYGSFQSRGPKMHFDILGDAFLKSIYAIFDQGKSRFGAVQRKELHQDTTVPE